jgi:nucleoside-diphosphate-sugar epimerase
MSSTALKSYSSKGKIVTRDQMLGRLHAFGKGSDQSPFRETALRVIADFISVNASMILAFVLWYFFSVTILKTPRPEDLGIHFRNFIAGSALIWSLVAVLIFQFHGFYSRTRGYAHRYKALIVVRAITVFVAAFALADYILYRGALFPPGVGLLTWCFLLVSVGGSRLAKYWFLERYSVESKRPSIKPDLVLVLGGAGYLGSALVPMLLDRGYRVRVLDSLLFGKESLVAVESHPKFELIPGDVRDIQVVVQAMKGCGAVIHLAGIVGDPACAENETLAAQTNRAATSMLIDVARGYGIQRFLLASTCSVYGASDFLMDEHAQVVPISLYAQTKLDSEKLLLDARCADFHPTILRMATLFGLSPRPRFDLVVNLLTARAIRAGKITIFNGEQWRPFMHVHDAARAFLACLEIKNLDVISGEIFNAGAYDLNHRLSEIGEMIAKVIPTVAVERVENEDRRNYRVTFDKIHTRIGFTCERTLEQGIKEMAEMIRRSTVADFSAATFNNLAMIRMYGQTAGPGKSSITHLASLSRVPSVQPVSTGNSPMPPPIAPADRAVSVSG